MVNHWCYCNIGAYSTKKCSEKKLSEALFMDVKAAFDHISKSQLLQHMIDLGINGGLIVWTKSFFTNQKNSVSNWRAW